MLYRSRSLEVFCKSASRPRSDILAVCFQYKLEKHGWGTPVLPKTFSSGTGPMRFRQLRDQRVVSVRRPAGSDGGKGRAMQRGIVLQIES